MKKSKRSKKPADVNTRKTSVHFTMRMPRSVRRSLQSRARRERVTAAQVVVNALAAQGVK